MINGILYIAYFYPPAGGLGTPAVQRIRRFINYLAVPNVHVLTMHPRFYPPYIKTCKDSNLSIKNETVHRTRDLDAWDLLLRIRARLKTQKILGRNQGRILSGQTCAASDEQRDSSSNNIIGCFSTILKYPDFASPWLLPAITRGLSIIKAHGIDTIFATGMPWTSLLIGVCLKWLTGKRLIVDFRDPWVNNPYIDKNVVEKQFDSVAEHLIVKNCDFVVVNTDALKSEMQARYKTSADKIIYLPNGYDTVDFDDIPDLTLFPTKLTLTHAGFLYSKRDPKPILKAIEAIKISNPPLGSLIQLCQIGRIDLAYDLYRHAEEKQLTENLTILDEVDHKHCLGYLAASDVLVVIQQGTKTQIPSKVYEYIYFEKPILVITQKNTALSRLILQYSFGEVFEPQEHEKLVSWLADMAKRKQTGDFLTSHHPNKQIFDARNLVSRFAQQISNHIQ